MKLRLNVAAVTGRLGRHEQALSEAQVETCGNSAHLLQYVFFELFTAVFSTKKIKMGLTFAGPHIWAQVVCIVRVDHHTFGFASGIVDANSLMLLFDIT